jgi:hypothetical protein
MEKKYKIDDVKICIELKFYTSNFLLEKNYFFFERVNSLLAIYVVIEEGLIRCIIA